MYIYKVLKNNEVTFIGTTEEMEFTRKVYVLKEKWWIEKDKIVYAEVENVYSANLYKKLLRTLYGLDEDNSPKFVASEGFITDNLDYKVFFDSKEISVISNDESNRIKLLEENQKRKEKLITKKNKMIDNIKRAYYHPEITKSFRMIPLHSGYYPKSNKKHSIYELMKILIVVPKSYSLKGLREIKRLYLRISEERVNTLICQKDIDNLIEKFGEFSLLKINGDECENSKCTYSPLFTSPAFFIKSLNYKEYEEKLGFEKYSKDNYFYTIDYQIYCPHCAPEIVEKIKQRRINKQKEVIRKNSHGIELQDKEFWRAMILELDDELKEAVGNHLTNIYINLKSNPNRAEHSIKVLYELGFAKQIPKRIKDKRPYIPGIYYVGDYYYEKTLSQEFKELKNIETNEEEEY